MLEGGRLRAMRNFHRVVISCMDMLIFCAHSDLDEGLLQYKFFASVLNA